MTNHLSLEQIENYYNRQVPPAMLIAADNHLATCQSCRARLEQAAQSEFTIASIRDNLLRATQESNHISYQLLESYIDGKVGPVDREIVASHVEFCRRCAAELKDLRAFAVAMASNPKIERPVEEVGFWKRFFSTWTPLRLAFTAAAAMLLVGVTASVWFVMRSGDSPRTSVATNPGERTGANVKAQAKPSEEPTSRGSAQSLSENRRPDLIQKPIPFALSPGRLSTITIPNIAGAVQLVLTDVRASDYKKLSVSLVRSFDGASREIEASKSNDSNEAVVILRTSELMKGKYTLTVKGEPVSGPSESSSMREVTSFTILVVKL